MADSTDLTTLLVAIANLHHNTAVDLLTTTPWLATARLPRRDEFFLAERLAQVYEGDTGVACCGIQLRPRDGTRSGHTRRRHSSP